jgi:hypothetical protein
MKEVTVAFDLSTLPALYYLRLIQCSFSTSHGVVQIGGNIKYVLFDTVVGIQEILHINISLFELSLFFVQFVKIVLSHPVARLWKKYDISRPLQIENENLVRFICQA